jgi:hypothetical protein
LPLGLLRALFLQTAPSMSVARTPFSNSCMIAPPCRVHVHLYLQL